MTDPTYTARMTHNHCHHVFKFCSQCDLVYCTSCHREWGGHQHRDPYYPYWSIYPITTTGNPWQHCTSWGTDVNILTLDATTVNVEGVSAFGGQVDHTHG